MGFNFHGVGFTFYDNNTLVQVMTRLIIGVLLCVLGPAWAKNTYIVTVPRQIRAGAKADIYIAPINPIERGANVVVTLLDKDNTTLATKRESIYSLRQPAVVKVNVPDTIPAGHDYKMKVKVSGGLSFDKTVTRIRATTKATSIFIQTDKAIYKPGDLGKWTIRTEQKPEKTSKSFDVERVGDV
ncbi:CD109 [Mytilus coruscus]|uniref:CD109 n=1 Tax=Mytilus coruscus TaxID=42192 RepID=A0A6J7ZXR7_MYTCO|nr:CD109 [Mytilus coruscus]